MNLRERLSDDLKVAMKAKDVTARQTLRMVLAAIKNRSIEQGGDLDDAAVLAVLAKEVKMRQDSFEQYTNAERDDLAQVEQAEMKVLEGYLPRQLDEAATRKVVQEVIAKLGLTQKQEMGQVMKAVMADHKGRVDGRLVQRIAGDLLG